MAYIIFDKSLHLLFEDLFNKCSESYFNYYTFFSQEDRQEQTTWKEVSGFVSDLVSSRKSNNYKLDFSHPSGSVLDDRNNRFKVLLSQVYELVVKRAENTLHDGSVSYKWQISA